MSSRRLACVTIAIATVALACRQGQPVNDPKPEPNSPLPKVERPDNDGTTTTTSSPLAPFKRDAG